MKTKTIRTERLKTALQSVKDWKSGKTKLRSWKLDDAGHRQMFYQSYEEYQKEKQPGEKLKGICQELGVSQKNFAHAMRTSVRTLQGWEIGKNVPTPALVLAELLRDSRDVRKRLMPELAK